MPSRASAWAVVTVYRPDSTPPLLAQLAPQVDGIVVVDDGSGPDVEDVLQAVRRLGHDVLALTENSGIGAALNAGIRRAREAGADLIVTFDQDSEVSSTYVEELMTAHDAATAASFAAGPVVPEYFADVSQAEASDASSPVLASHAIQSGMLIPVNVLDRVGMMDEHLFIDLVDTDFELRCAAAGLPCIVSRGSRLEHRLGARYRLRGPLGALLPAVTLSTPFRYYYRARNRIIIDRRHRRFRSRLIREGLADRIYFLVALALAKPRRPMWVLLRRGTQDGRAGRGGRMPADLAAQAAAITWRAERQPE
ncbi:glycosyltransferase [Microbacterium sp. 3J1]|uniref:glycosyltransferase n=1 Tax=Microbacterium sp. 3J1 TaxID=861269 RepID=UPI000A956F7E|nr:glycosyltransferase [Microbacterium sp. 3J1]